MGAVAAVVPGCAAPGSSGGRRLRLAGNLEIAVWVIVMEQRERGRRLLRAPLTLGVPLVSRGVPPVVLPSVGPTHGMLVSRWVTQNSAHTKYLTVCAPWVSEFSECRKNKGYVKDGLNTEGEKNSRCVERRKAMICFHGAHRHTHTFIHGLPNQALRTERLPVTIWKKFRRNRRVLSVPR